MQATVVDADPVHGAELIEIGEHRIQFGGPNGDGFCYACQSFDCLDNLTDEEMDAVKKAERHE